MRQSDENARGFGVEVPAFEQRPADCSRCDGCPWLRFLGLSPKDTTGRPIVEAECTFLIVRRGQSIYGVGDQQNGLDMVRSGLLQATATSIDGREVVTELIEPGMISGLAEFFGRRRRRSRLSAIVPSVICHIPESAVRRIMEHFHMEDWLHLLSSMAETAQRLEQRIRSMALLDVKERVAAYLLERAERAPALPDGSISIRLPAPQGIVASYLGSSREAISRTLRFFREQKLIDSRSKTIRILDPEGLRNSYVATSRVSSATAWH